MNKYSRIALGPVIYLARWAYLCIFARPAMQSLNDFVLGLAMRARGYDNYQDIELTGEYAFIRRLARHGPDFA